MAGDWIKMRMDLQSHPKVVRMMSALRADKFRVIGGLHAVWSVFDAHSEDGRLDGYTPYAMDCVIGWEGFTGAMLTVGWIDVDTDETLVMPRFDEHNGKSAKRRAQETVRKRDARKAEDGPQNVCDLSASDADEKRSREEKRREESKTKGSNTAPSDSEVGGQIVVPTRAVDLSVALRSCGIQSNPSDPRLQALAEQGVTADTVRAAAEAAKEAKPNERISPAYVVAIVERWAAEASRLNVAGATAPARGASKAQAIEQHNRDAVEEAARRIEARTGSAAPGSFGPPDDPYTIDMDDMPYATH